MVYPILHLDCRECRVVDKTNLKNLDTINSIKTWSLKFTTWQISWFGPIIY